ncbi:uncharacterized protein EDB91DRAFT_497264 [Suillus paluster]|uniref:uncharacterized protein n=1 Tax=Suillus paluster TaxID=48578 RepID=UPI001B863602|nr:uncharacterized protein EDB91DRAFT_497264 [Suillus paluster]KAG1736925.1 hypothetical protein EDB91DRAFT_497264 [Suillus paluster]
MATTTSITPEEIQGLDLYLLAVPNIQYISLAGLTLLTWDLILTFPHELRLWNSRWTLTKTLFLVRLCALSHCSPQYLMLIRNRCSANAFFAVIALLLVANIESKLSELSNVSYTHRSLSDSPTSIICIVRIWVPMMGLDFVLVVLAGYKSLQHYFQVPDKTWSGAHLMRTFARDSILYFLCNFLIYLFSTLLGKFGPPEYYQLGAITITVVPPVSANRLLINMYDSARAKQPTWTTVSQFGVSLQARDTMRVHHKEIELAFISAKSSRWMEASSFDDISGAV